MGNGFRISARANASDAPVNVVMLTHAARERNVQSALAEIASLHHVAEPTRLLRIEEG